MEPLRPLVDEKVRELYRAGRGIRDGLDQPTKASLLSVLTRNVEAGGTVGPLMVGLHRLTASFLRCLRGEEDRLVVPDWSGV
jgi:hypothetical protein